MIMLRASVMVFYSFIIDMLRYFDCMFMMGVNKWGCFVILNTFVLFLSHCDNNNTSTLMIP